MKRKFLSLLLALAMIGSLLVPAMAAEETPVTPYAIPADVKGKLVVIHTNDTHGRDVAVEGKTIGTAGVAQLKKDFEAAGATVILASAGDFSQGTTLVSLDKGASAVTFMNAAGYDVATLGNHEFDYKMDALKANVKAAEFPILVANLVDAATKKPLFGDNKVFETAIGKVGVFGLDTPETMTKAHPDNVKGLDFYQGDELVKCAQAQVDALKKAGCTYIIALTHLGVSEESDPNRSTDIFNKVTGVNLVVDGHSHTEMEGEAAKTAGGAMVVSTGEYLTNVGVVITDGKTTTSQLVSAAEYTKVDADVNKIVNDAAAKIAEEMAKTFGKTEVLLNGARDPGNRTQETNLGDFATDAILWSARQNLGEDKVDAALTNGGGIRESIKAGDITMNDMKTVFPFGNAIVTIDVTGAQLLEALEAATWSTPTAIGAFPQVSGIEFIINSAVPYENGEQYPDSTYYAPKNPGARVTIATVNGKTFDKAATYTIATNDFTAAGGDTYYVFKAAKNLTQTAIALEDALVNYTKDVLGGTVTAEKYGTTGDRITIIPDDVKTDVWYTDAVHYVIGEGIMVGAGGKFNPSGTVTRATVIEMLYKLEGKPAEGLDKAAFNDLEGKWYSNSAHWAAFIGIVKGQADGGFHGDDVITRAELAQIIANYAKYAEITVDTTGMAMKEAGDYDKIPAEYLEGMTFCYYAKLMTGNQSGLLLPGDNLTRDALAQIMFSFAKLPVPAAKAA